MILTEEKSRISFSDPSKILDDYDWFLPSKCSLEKILFEDIRRGDPKAQLKFYKFYYIRMFDLSYRIVCNTDAADEVVRESFMVAFEKTGVIKRQVDFILFLSRLVEERSVESRSRNNTLLPGLAQDRILTKSNTNHSK